MREHSYASSREYDLSRIVSEVLSEQAADAYLARMLPNKIKTLIRLPFVAARSSLTIRSTLSSSSFDTQSVLVTLSCWRNGRYFARMEGSSFVDESARPWIPFAVMFVGVVLNRARGSPWPNGVIALIALELVVNCCGDPQFAACRLRLKIVRRIIAVQLYSSFLSIDCWACAEEAIRRRQCIDLATVVINQHKVRGDQAQPMRSEQSVSEISYQIRGIRGRN